LRQSDLYGSSMSDASVYKEKAQLFSDAANAAADERVRMTLLRLARSALRTATQMEALYYKGSPPGRRESDE
jgi:hypothetical protein